MSWKSDIITISHAPKDVEHVTEKADVLLWQHHLDEHFSGSCDEQSNFLGIRVFFLFQHMTFAQRDTFQLEIMEESLNKIVQMLLRNIFNIQLDKAFIEAIILSCRSSSPGY